VLRAIPIVMDSEALCISFSCRDILPLVAPIS
jgi:hypothetical protein